MPPPPADATSLPCEPFQQYDCPLDLLLDEVRCQNVEIETVAMAPIVARFLAYVGSAATRNLNLDIDWLLMAATLIHWKSQSLLPPLPAATPEPDRIRDSLVQQLLAHHRQAAEALEQRRSLVHGRFSHAEPAPPETTDSPEPAGVSVWDLIQQARELAVWTAKFRLERSQFQDWIIEQDDVTVSQMMEYLSLQLSSGAGAALDGSKLLREQSTPSRSACLFLGMLEMAKNRDLELEQNELFGPLLLLPR